MKRWFIWLSSLILILGAAACTTNELPAATSAGFLNPQASATSSQPATQATNQNSPKPTQQIIPTATVSPTSLPTKTPLPTAITCENGQIVSEQLDSALLDDPLKYIVYLPPCYQLRTESTYPVVYLFHGQTYSNTHWIDLGATEIADRLIENGEMAPFIMVFPYDRDHYDPPTINPFGEAVLTELIPTIDQSYRTISKREFRAVGGISRGGNWAAHLVLQNPEIFGAIGLHSTPIFSTDTNPEIIDWLEAIPVEIFSRLYMDAGKNDRWLQFTLTFVDLIDRANLPHEWHLYPGYHEDAYWQSHLEEYLRWYTQPWNRE